MRYFTIIFILSLSVSLVFYACEAAYSKPTASGTKAVKIFKSFKELDPYLNKDNDTTYIINFWATTCPPCLKEMPHFEAYAKYNEHSKIKILLVSLDLFKHLESRVKPFVEKLKLTNDVGLLVDQNYSVWTAKVNSDWYGSLPYTVIYNHRNKDFYSGAFPNYASLERAVNKVD